MYGRYSPLKRIVIATTVAYMVCVLCFIGSRLTSVFFIGLAVGFTLNRESRALQEFGWSSGAPQLRCEIYFRRVVVNSLVHL